VVVAQKSFHLPVAKAPKKAAPPGQWKGDRGSGGDCGQASIAALLSNLARTLKPSLQPALEKGRRHLSPPAARKDSPCSLKCACQGRGSQGTQCDIAMKINFLPARKRSSTRKRYETKIFMQNLKWKQRQYFLASLELRFQPWAFAFCPPFSGFISYAKTASKS